MASKELRKMTECNPRPHHEEMIAVIRAAIELANQLPHDLCGEQREFTLPRISIIYLGLIKAYPALVNRAYEGAVDGYGEKLV